MIIERSIVIFVKLVADVSFFNFGLSYAQRTQYLFNFAMPSMVSIIDSQTSRRAGRFFALYS